MSGASGSGGGRGEAEARDAALAGAPASVTLPTDPSSLNNYLLGVATAAAAIPGSYNHLLLRPGLAPAAAAAAAPPNAQLLQLLALQQWQAAQSQLLPAALSAQINPQALTALYYNQLLGSAAALPPQSTGAETLSGSALGRHATLPVHTAAPAHHSPAQQPSPVAQPIPRGSVPTAALHPALSRLASGETRRKSAPVIPVSAPSEWPPPQPQAQQRSSLSEEAAKAVDSAQKPVLSSPKAITDHIDALISENEAIVLPQAPLLQKRRSYHRHNPAEGPSKSYPGMPSPSKKQNASRSASLVESQLSPNVALQAQRQAHLANYPHRASLPANLPIFPEGSVPPGGSGPFLLNHPMGHQSQAPPPIPTSSAPTYKCQHCQLDFTSDKALQAHVFRCSLNMSIVNPPPSQVCPPRQPLGPALSFDQLLLLRQQQQQQLLQHQAEQLLAAQKATPSPSTTPVTSTPAGSSVPAPKSQHPLKKRILAELETTAAAQALSQPASPPLPKVPKLEPPPTPGPSTDVFRPLASKPPHPHQVLSSIAEASPLMEGSSLMEGSPMAISATASALPNHAIALSVSLSAEEKAQRFTPYTRTLEVEGSEKLESPRSGRRPRHVTAPTFVCMKRPQPFFLLHTDPKRSMYSSWQQVHVSPVEAKLNLLWMGGCCTRPRKGTHAFWKYTLATKDLSVPRMTHSTFAQVSKKLRATQEQEAAEAAKTEAEAETTAETSTTKERLWHAALHESATRTKRRLSVSHKRHLSVESNKSEESVESGRLEISSPMTSDTDDACEISDSERVEKEKEVEETESSASELCQARFVGSSAKTPPLLGSAAAVSARLDRDCQSVPAIPVSWPPNYTSNTPVSFPIHIHPCSSTSASSTAAMEQIKTLPVSFMSPTSGLGPAPSALLQKSPLGLPGAGAVPAPLASGLSPFLVSATSLECTICDKRFAKPDQLRLHMDIHVYQDGARKKTYACTVCGQNQASKTGLLKHMSSVHPGEPLPPDPTIKDDAPPTDNRNNPRPFKCTDCDTAFRGQGFLQKHLRSKLHVMKLECTQKLPYGTYALFETANFNLAEIDTTDCESALASMRRHYAALQPSFPSATLAAPEQHLPPDNSQTTPDHSQPQPSQPPPTEPVPVVPAPALPILPSEPKVLPSAFHPPSPPPKAEETEPETSPKVSASSSSSDGSNKLVSADVWVPPKEDDLVKADPPPPPQPPAKLERPKPSPEETSDESQHSFRENGETMTNGQAPSGSKKMTSPEAEIVEKPSTPQVHICHFCKLQTMSGTDLEVHLHADHIAMKDGNDFRCPRPNCDKIYPNRESLRLHIAAHYLGGGAASQGPSLVSDRDGDVSRETMAALQRKLGAGGAPGPASSVPPAGTVGNQSPGTPEESQTSFAAVTGGRKKMKTHLVALNSIPEAAPAASPSLSEPASDASSPSPLPQPPGSAKKRKSLEEQFPSPLGKRDLVSGRRCASALENNSAFAAPLQLSSPSYSLPAVPAQMTQHAPLSWFRNGLLHSQFALLHQALPQLHPQNGEIKDQEKREKEASRKEETAAPSTAIHCPICQLSVPDVEELQRHLVSHVSSRPHICPQCDAGFTTAAALTAHAVTHPQTPPHNVSLHFWTRFSSIW